MTSVELGCISTHKTGEKLDLVKELFLQKRTITNTEVTNLSKISCVSIQSTQKENQNLGRIAVKFVCHLRGDE